ncbi:MAG TPA: transglutaminase-like domain-containing protein [Nostocaceae cyanobacterium]|nr:transglutaminase-like domain-containing protein [Nostocaceae cyanobacterium]
MKIPKLLLGAALIFWGWQTGLWFFALPMAIILECSHFWSLRWDLSNNDLLNIAKLSFTIALIFIVYLLIANQSIYFIYTFLKWLPIIVFPLLAAQKYSTQENIEIPSDFFILNKILKIEAKHFILNLSYPYFVLCILSASAANTQNISFYLGMFVLSALAFWFVRSKRYSPAIWLCFILTAGSVGFIGQIGLHQLHLSLEENVVNWLSNNNGQEVDTFKKKTDIGEIGILKQSNNIIFRVASETPNNFPLLLREATYNKYQSGLWSAVNPNFTPIKSEDNGTTWILGEKPKNSSQVTISATLNDGQGFLKLADGTFQIDQLPVSNMEKSQYGAVKVEGKVEPISYQIQFNQNFSFDSPPTADDLQIANKEKSVLKQIISQLDIQGKPPEEILKRVEIFFRQNFTYSLNLAGKDNYSTPLSTFLLKTRSGHCEYFATATTLLLRSVGIPSRYAVGYSVHEFSPLENQYLVRSRHAHAWSLVYLKGRWQAVDTTPADWTSIEAANVSQWSFITDLWSLLSFKVSGGLRYLIEKFNYWWLILFLVLILMRQFVGKKPMRRLSTQQIVTQPITKYDIIGNDSEFYLIEKKLTELGLVRHPSESLKNWVKRLKQENQTSVLIDDLTFVIELHYLYRFDPQGINEDKRTQLKSAAQLWLEKYSNSN